MPFDDGEEETGERRQEKGNERRWGGGGVKETEKVESEKGSQSEKGHKWMAEPPKNQHKAPDPTKLLDL